MIKKDLFWIFIKGFCHKPNRFTSTVIFSLIVIIGFFSAGCTKEQEENPNTVSRPVKTLSLTKVPYKVNYYYPGKASADKKAILSFEVKGKVVKLPVQVGQKVNKGDLLAQLETTHYENRYKECLSKYNETKKQYERAKKLTEKRQVIPIKEYDRRLKDFKVATSQMNIAKKELKDTSLYAPYNGVIAKRFIELYQEVQEKEEIFLFQDLKYLEITVYIPGKNLISSKKDEKLNCYAIFSSAPKKTFKLELKEQDTVADPQTLSYKVVFRMPHPKALNILPGMTVRVKIVKTVNNKAKMKPVFKVPIEAVMPSKDKSSYVWVVDNKTSTVYKQKVTIDQLSESFLLIDSGLKAGETIVVSGVHHLQEGQKVHQYKHGINQK